MSRPTLSKQPVCGVSLAYTVNTWLFSNELDDKLGAGNSHWATGWGEGSVPYSHWPIYSENAYWTPTVCHCIKCWILFPFDLLDDTRRLPMPQFFAMYVLPRHFKSSIGSHLSITCIDCTCIVSILCLLPCQPSVESVAGHLSSTLCHLSSCTPLASTPSHPTFHWFSWANEHRWWYSQNCVEYSSACWSQQMFPGSSSPGCLVLDSCHAPHWLS